MPFVAREKIVVQRALQIGASKELRFETVTLLKFYKEFPT